jgi:hypothetical protein
LAKIAAELWRGARAAIKGWLPGQTTPRVIARGEGWSVADVVSHLRPAGQTREERHSQDMVRSFRPEASEPDRRPVAG